MRLFIAAEIGQVAKEELAKAQDLLGGSEARLTIVKDFHLTLKFLGDVSEDSFAEIKNRLTGVEFSKFEARLEGAGVFPSEGYVRVVWVGIEPKEGIIELQKKIEDSLGGMFPKDNQFHPHITLARVKYVNDKQGFLGMIKKIKVDSNKSAFIIDRFKLIKSTLTPEGPIYDVLAEFKAKGL